MKLRLVLVGLVLVTSFILAACDLFQKTDGTTTTTVAPVSINARLNTFVSALNSDRGHAYLNFDTTTDSYIGGSSSSSYWNGFFPTMATYVISGIDSSDSSNVTATLTGGGSFSGGIAVGFVMDAVTSGVFLINKMYIDGNTSGGTLFLQSVHR